jgi:positive regulator of sigma E activity
MPFKVSKKRGKIAPEMDNLLFMLIFYVGPFFLLFLGAVLIVELAQRGHAWAQGIFWVVTASVGWWLLKGLFRG